MEPTHRPSAATHRVVVEECGPDAVHTALASSVWAALTYTDMSTPREGGRPEEETAAAAPPLAPDSPPSPLPAAGPCSWLHTRVGSSWA